MSRQRRTRRSMPTFRVSWTTPVGVVMAYAWSVAMVRRLVAEHADGTPVVDVRHRDGWSRVTGALG